MKSIGRSMQCLNNISIVPGRSVSKKDKPNIRSNRFTFSAALIPKGSKIETNITYNTWPKCRIFFCLWLVLLDYHLHIKCQFSFPFGVAF
jgi:hypothetical protein